MNEIISKFTKKQATIEELEPNIVDAGESFNDIIYELWKKLMTIEMTLFEQCEVPKAFVNLENTNKILCKQWKNR